MTFVLASFLLYFIKWSYKVTRFSDYASSVWNERKCCANAQLIIEKLISRMYNRTSITSY